MNEKLSPIDGAKNEVDSSCDTMETLLHDVRRVMDRLKEMEESIIDLVMTARKVVEEEQLRIALFNETNIEQMEISSTVEELESKLAEFDWV